MEYGIWRLCIPMIYYLRRSGSGREEVADGAGLLAHSAAGCCRRGAVRADGELAARADRNMRNMDTVHSHAGSMHTLASSMHTTSWSMHNSYRLAR